MKGEIRREKKRRGCQNEVEMEEEAGGGGMEGERMRSISQRRRVVG